jgi:hypothetical protein
LYYLFIPPFEEDEYGLIYRTRLFDFWRIDARSVAGKPVFGNQSRSKLNQKWEITQNSQNFENKNKYPPLS